MIQDMEQHEGFEQRLTQVQAIIDSIEGGQMPLEEAVRQYEAGIQSLNQLEKELTEMKRHITILQQGEEISAEEKE